MIPEKHFEDLNNFIRAHRSSEAHFEKLYEKLTAAYEFAKSNQLNRNGYADLLKDVMEKHGDAYKQKKDNGISAWAEFENFVTHFERAVLAAT
jgi:hypothetical protein